MSDATESGDWWDDALYGAAMPPAGDGDHILTEARMRAICVSDIQRLIPTGEQARWNDGGAYHPATEPTTELMRRLMTSEQSSMTKLPDTLTFLTHQVALRHAPVYRCAHTNWRTSAAQVPPAALLSRIASGWSTEDGPMLTTEGSEDNLGAVRTLLYIHKRRTHRAHCTEPVAYAHRSRPQVRPTWERMQDVTGDRADALKKKALLTVVDLSGKLHPHRKCIMKEARWICDQVRTRAARHYIL